MNNRDLELLSSYLDKQLDSHESARLESRVASDPELTAALADLRAARGILRKLPSRKAPRNFTLTRKMVGLNPPLPRAYSFFQYATAFASVLLMLTFAANLLAPRLGYVGPINGGMGGGGGGGPIMPQSAPAFAEEAAVATEAPAATEAPVAATEAPTEAPLAETTPLSTMTADSVREVPTATASAQKEAGTESVAQDQSEGNEPAAPPIKSGWQISLLMLGLIGAAVMFGLRQSAKRKWQ